jgi:hypothetical protein
MFKDLKTLHPGGIRTHDLLFCRRTQWSLCHAARASLDIFRIVSYPWFQNFALHGHTEHQPKCCRTPCISASYAHTHMTAASSAICCRGFIQRWTEKMKLTQIKNWRRWGCPTRAVFFCKQNAEGKSCIEIWELCRSGMHLSVQDDQSGQKIMLLPSADKIRLTHFILS